MTVLPLVRTEFPGVYRRGSRYVVVYRSGGRQCKQSAATLSEARALKVARDADAREQRRGPALQAYALDWLDRYAGSGHDSVRDNTRREYRRLLVGFALTYFDPEVRVPDLDRARVQQFIDWLTTQPGRDGRLRDRSIANAITPLRLALDAAVAEGLLATSPFEGVVLPRRRAGRAWEMRERASSPAPNSLGCLTRHRQSGCRCLSCSARPGCGSPRRSLCGGAIYTSTARRRGCRSAARSSRASSARRRRGTASASCHSPASSLRPSLSYARRVRSMTSLFSPGATADRRTLEHCAAGFSCRPPQRAGLTGVGFHTLRHTCASLLIESGMNVLRLQRWMGHHSPAFTLEVYGHLLDGDLAPPLDLSAEVRASTGSRLPASAPGRKARAT